MRFNSFGFHADDNDSPRENIHHIASRSRKEHYQPTHLRSICRTPGHLHLRRTLGRRNSSIPNTQGYRNDVLEALKALSIPNLRWPGGCFADEYHWMDGIGPREQRPRMVNNNWGGTVEDNSFGTHEFLNLCELLNCEPYVSGNVGSGSVEEMAKWIEYMTAQDGPMAKLSKQKGREKPW